MVNVILFVEKLEINYKENHYFIQIHLETSLFNRIHRKFVNCLFQCFETTTFLFILFILLNYIVPCCNIVYLVFFSEISDLVLVDPLVENLFAQDENIWENFW